MRYTNYPFPVFPEKVCRVIVDTDAHNEADDQYAIVHALLSPKFEIPGFVAAHYGISRDPDSMQHSYEELYRLFDAAECPHIECIFHGAEHPLTEKKPVVSEGARLIVAEAMKEDPRPLYVLFLGPLTDMASAYLMEPRIAQRCTVIWIGGGSYPNGGKEFNAGNDVLAANVVMESPLPLWQVPKNVYEMMAISFSELEVKVAPKGRLGAYLFNELMQHAATKVPRESAFRTGETWVLGDSPAVGLILYPQRYEYDEIPAPQLSEQQQYLPGLDPLRTIRVYKRIDSRLILEDFFAKLSLYDSTWWKRNT